jgi:DNA-binding winged helix-turn-helix (wHTH) protein/TolB-like protein/Tfp pilus assembly protein PilF
MTSSNKQPSYEFNRFCLDLSERQLLHGDSRVPLTPKVFDVLAVLVTRSGHLVEKDELLRLVWEDAFVEESNIARIIHTLRKTLGETNENKFIETVAKRGYRFVAGVNLVNGASSQQPEMDPAPALNSSVNNVSATASDVVRIKERNGKLSSPAANDKADAETEAKRPKGSEGARVDKRAVAVWTIGALLILAVAAAGFWFATTSRTPTGNGAGKSLAVLPLKPISTELRDPIYELGIAESLIHKLSSARKLTVRPLSATRKYQEIDQSPTAAGREQGVDFVLTSNYQVSGGKIRVTSQLINVQTGNIEEVFKSEEDAANVFAMQDAIANDIGNSLLARFGGNIDSLTSKRGTENEEAYRLFLRAVYIFDQVNKAEAGKAMEYLEEAVRLDPNFAAAHATLAFAYVHMPATHHLRPPEQYNKAKAAAEKALELEPGMAEAHAASAVIKATFEGDFDGAEKEYKRAIELDPRSSAAHSLYALQLAGQGRFDEGIAEVKMAILVEPGNISHHITHGMVLYYAHRYDEAMAQFRRIQEMAPHFAYAQFWQWLLHDLQGNEAQAWEGFVRYRTMMNADAETMKAFETAYQKEGWKGVMREHIVQDEKNLTPNTASTLYYEMACFSARLGNKDQAFEYLNKAHEERGYGLTLMKVDPYLDSLHGDPRFDEMVKKVGLR